MSNITQLFQGSALIEDPKAQITALIGAMSSMEQMELPLIHRFAGGMYAREISMPAGAVVVSKVHRYEHLTIVLTGRAQVRGEDGSLETIEAPQVFVTKPGRCRALHILEDSRWLTVHATALGTVEAVEAELVATDFDDYEARARSIEVQP